MVAANKKHYSHTPDYAVAPGEVLQETIDALGMTHAALARRTGLSKKAIDRLLQGQDPISADTALRLERATRVAARFWSNLEVIYRERRTRFDKKLNHVNRKLTAKERARHSKICDSALKEVPPKTGAVPNSSPPGIPTKIRQAREARGFTWYTLAKAAGIPSQATIRDIEQGRDVKFSNLQAVAAALGLTLELVEEVA